MTTTTDCGNNESVVRGVVRDEAGYLALTITDSRVFKTRAGAERWLAVRGYNADGTKRS